MSKATKRKHVTKEVLEDYYVPEDGEQIVKIIGGRGNNLHEVEADGGNKYLASMPTKFRKNVWVKRGDFVVVSPIEEGNKVKGEIVYVLYAKQIKYLKKEDLWPKYFDEFKKEEKMKETAPKSSCDNISNGAQISKQPSCEGETINKSSDDEEESSDDDELFENPNHRPIYHYEDDESTSSGEEDSDSNEEQEEDVNSIEDSHQEDGERQATNNNGNNLENDFKIFGIGAR